MAVLVIGLTIIAVLPLESVAFQLFLGLFIVLGLTAFAIDILHRYWRKKLHWPAPDAGESYWPGYLGLALAALLAAMVWFELSLIILLIVGEAGLLMADGGPKWGPLFPHPDHE